MITLGVKLNLSKPLFLRHLCIGYFVDVGREEVGFDDPCDKLR